MRHEEFINICIERVALEESNHSNINVDELSVFVVWSCKTLQNSKAILSASNKGAMLYEFTMNGDKQVIYMDAYNKACHEEILINDMA